MIAVYGAAIGAEKDVGEVTGGPMTLNALLACKILSIRPLWAVDSF